MRTAAWCNFGDLPADQCACPKCAPAVDGLHRTSTPVLTAPMPLRYKPHHCAGDSCLHDHAGDPRPRLGIFLPLLDRLTGGAA